MPEGSLSHRILIPTFEIFEGFEISVHEGTKIIKRELCDIFKSTDFSVSPPIVVATLQRSRYADIFNTCYF